MLSLVLNSLLTILSVALCVPGQIWPVLYVKAVGQDVSPGKCVLLSTCKSVGKRMKLWDVSGDGVALVCGA